MSGVVKPKLESYKNKIKINTYSYNQQAVKPNTLNISVNVTGKPNGEKGVKDSIVYSDNVSSDLNQYHIFDNVDDLNISADSNKTSSGNNQNPESSKIKEKSVDELAQDVLNGKYGNGQARKEALGDRYYEVQKKVNEKLYGPSKVVASSKTSVQKNDVDAESQKKQASKNTDSLNSKSVDELAQEVMNGKYGTGSKRKEALGDRYDEVQKRVNEIVSGKPSSSSGSESKTSNPTKTSTPSSKKEDKPKENQTSAKKEETAKTSNKSNRTYFEKVPLSNSDQDIIYECAEKYGLNPALVFAVIETESSFNKNIGINSSNCAGLMQMNLTYSKPYGVTKNNYSDVYTNVNGGCMLLAEKYKKYGNWDAALMAYNLGDGGAQKRIKNGQYSSSYSRTVLDRKAKY